MHRPVGIIPRDAMNIDSTMPTNGSASHGGFGVRRRSQRGGQACDMCYRKKTKCEVEGPQMVCVQCIRRKTKCIFPSQQQLQPQPQPQEKDDELQSSDQYVEALKHRLERVEALLVAAGVLHESDIGQDAISEDEDEDEDEDEEDDEDKNEQLDDRPISSGRVSNLSEGSEIARFSSGGDFALTPLFKSHGSDDSKYFGRCSSLSILSRGGIEWIKNKTGDTSFMSIISTDSIHGDPWNEWRPDVFHDLFASRVYKPLPPRSEVFSLIKDFFRTANRLFPIFHEASFMKMVEWQYTQQTCDDAARWASINMVICLAYEYRFSNSLKPEKDREKARLYFKNAMSVFTELALRRTDLLSVQALISMGFFLRGNSGTQSALPFMTAAMRSCQRMGLHRNIERPDLSPAQQEQRRRVFWVAFTVDQSTCLRAGNAPSQHPDDFDVPLPQLTEDDNDPEVAPNIHFFCQLCRMCLIKSRIYCRLYSAKSLLKEPDKIYETVKELSAELEAWKKDYPFSEVPKLKGAETDFLFGFASVGLHFVYYNALIMIHRIPLLLNFLIMNREGDSEELKSLSKAFASKSALICVTAARDTLKMVNNMPWGDIAWLWSLLYYVFLSAATIFSNILRDTRSPAVKEDLQSLNMAATFFATLVSGDGPASYAGFMTQMSATLERIARLAVDRDEKRARSFNDEEEEDQPSESKRQSFRASHPKLRHRGPTHRSFNPAAHQPQATAPSVPNSSTATHQDMIDPSIPEAIEGFPPVNSSGYVVVPMSPGDNDFRTTTNIHQQPTYPTGLGLSDLSGADTDPTFGNTYPSWQLAQDHAASTAPSPHDNTQSPYSQVNSNGTGTMIPESWQVPLTADWRFGENLWAGLFRGNSMQQTSLPILDKDSFLNGPMDPEAMMNNNFGNDLTGFMGYGTQTMGYNFMPPEPQDQDQDPNQSQSGFSNNFMGMF
ncbi:uncharacterized protein N7484_003197 [Penicillium longicatenatum]|uniref:uncharacterized protein n=1 Tax=Penicillium longicatenatum TaxID=1561947 RepID=UPI002547FF7C|nr:uncharacterized protein N7484_003197 [Penicillium longicatenatum]KAJ5649474.1 hypothetical protein N7484_003197 [Penicillium longicatenatum]